MRHDANLSAQSEAGRRVPNGIRGAARNASARARTRSYPGSQQLSARHPQIGRGEQGHELRGVLLLPSIADLGVAELSLDHPERLLDLGRDAGLDSLD